MSEICVGYFQRGTVLVLRFCAANDHTLDDLTQYVFPTWVIHECVLPELLWVPCLGLQSRFWLQDVYQAHSGYWQNPVPWGCILHVSTFLLTGASPTDGSRFPVPYHTASCASINITLQSQQENLCLQEGHTSSFKNFYQIKAGLHRVILIWLTQNQLIWGINYIFKIPSSLSYVLT